MVRRLFVLTALLLVALVAAAAQVRPGAWWAFVVVGPLVLLGVYDMVQSKHAVLRNFPVIGHGRYLLEMV
ncbi:hypothetical protein, partial [Oceanithermus profundus]